MSYITGAASLVEPGLDVLFVYNIRCPSGNRYLAGDASPHSPQTYIQAYCIDAYLSLLEEQQAQHTQRLPKKSQKGCQYVLRKRDPLENRAKRAKKKAVNVVERISWKDCVWK